MSSPAGSCTEVSGSGKIQLVLNQSMHVPFLLARLTKDSTQTRYMLIPNGFDGMNFGLDGLTEGQSEMVKGTLEFSQVNSDEKTATITIGSTKNEYRCTKN